jgi:hypothetical protein
MPAVTGIIYFDGELHVPARLFFSFCHGNLNIGTYLLFEICNLLFMPFEGRKSVNRNCLMLRKRLFLYR